MDERQLAELFRDAADGGPPAGFGHADVVAASRRATARRRNAIAGGSVVAVAVLVGGIVIGGGVLRDADRGGTEQAASAGSAEVPSVAGGDLPSPALGDQQGRVPGPLAAPPSSTVDKNDPEADAEQGRSASGKVVPWPGLRDDDARAGCGPVDRALADALIGELPATPNATPQAVPDQCPGARAAAVPVDGGMVYGVIAPVRGDGPPDHEVKRDDGAFGYFVYSPAGHGVLVLSVPATAGGKAPHGDQMKRIAVQIGRGY